MRKFTLGLDLDGVCADYVAGFRHYLAATLGADPAAMPDTDTYSFAAWPVVGSDAQFARLHAAAVSDGLYRRLPVMPGAVAALQRLSRDGVLIRVITHRLLVPGQHAIAAGDTIAWLDAHRIPVDDLCFTGDKHTVDADLYLDDAPVNIRALRAAGAHVMTFDATYNRDDDGPRVLDWTDAERVIRVAMRQWERFAA